MAYMLGFIASDGCVDDKHLIIGLKSTDVEILEKFKKELQFTGNLHTRTIYSKQTNKTYNSSCLYVSSKYMVERLNQLGIVRNKSMKLERFDFIPQEYELDFIRGYFDGDGSVGAQLPKSKRAQTETIQIRVRICSGSYKILEYIRDTLMKYGFNTKTIVKRGNKTLFEICYSTKESLLFFEKVYNSESLYLQRKYDKFSELIQQRNIEAINSKGHIKVK